MNRALRYPCHMGLNHRLEPGSNRMLLLSLAALPIAQGLREPEAGAMAESFSFNMAVSKDTKVGE